MAQQQTNPDEVVIGQEIGGARVATLNRPRQLNGISDRVVYLLAQFLEKWEKDENAKLVIFKGAGRAFSAGGDLKMFYEGKSDDSCLEVVYRMYWLCYHIHTYKRTTVALVNGLVMGGGAAMVAPLKFAAVTEKTVFATPEASVGLHTDCSFSYIHSRLPGYLGEYLALTGARLNAKEMIAAGLATHFVPSEESEGSIDGNQWIAPVLKGIRRSSPTALKMTLRSIREGRKQSLAECLKKEFRLTMNTLRSVVTDDVYEGIRALSIDKDNAPKWSPATLEKVKIEDIDRLFEPFSSEKELQVPSDDSNR
uniref:3-hydroxyisobutyryl-CoA hydrolase n=1 Tax=Leersia perrieri TaxID=77586 RepID=A0A0D9V5Q0_9ORYZ